MTTEIHADLDAAQSHGYDAVCRDAERAANLPGGTLLAIASRETGCRDIVGDHGHGRGLFQIDDRSFGQWLAAHGAGAPGSVPSVREAAAFAAQLVRENLDVGRRSGVREADLLKFALSAYNAGAGGALSGYRRGDSDLNTTGGDYGRDVLARRDGVLGWLAGGATGRATLQPGARGDAVSDLKRLLASWFATHPPAPSFAKTPVYGPASVEAVREFQRRSGLAADGVVGPATWGALATAAGAQRPT